MPTRPLPDRSSVSAQRRATPGAMTSASGDADAHVLDAPESAEEGARRLVRALAYPVTRASGSWRAFAMVRFSCPTSASEATSRARKNAMSFGYCYVVVVMAVTAALAVRRVVTAAALAGCYLGHHYVVRARRKPIEVGGKTVSVKVQDLTILVGTILVFWSFLTEVIARGCIAGGVFSLAHATMRVPDAKTDEDESGEIPLLRDFAHAYHESGLGSYVPPAVSAAVRGVFARK